MDLIYLWSWQICSYMYELCSNCQLDSIKIVDLRLCSSMLMIPLRFDPTARQFLQHLKNQQPLIKFTTEQEENNTISFLDVQVTRNGTLVHTVDNTGSRHNDWFPYNPSFHYPHFKNSLCHQHLESLYHPFTTSHRCNSSNIKQLAEEEALPSRASLMDPPTHSCILVTKTSLIPLLCSVQWRQHCHLECPWTRRHAPVDW